MTIKYFGIMNSFGDILDQSIVSTHAVVFNEDRIWKSFASANNRTDWKELKDKLKTIGGSRIVELNIKVLVATA